MSNWEEVFGGLARVAQSLPRAYLDDDESWRNFLEYRSSTNMENSPLSEVEEAFDNLTHIMHTYPRSHWKQDPRILEYLANGLAQIFELEGAMAYIEKAVQYMRQAIMLSKNDSIRYRMRLSTLGEHLRRRHYGNTLMGKVLEHAITDFDGAMADLNEAVKIQTEVVDSAPDTDIFRPIYMGNLARSLGDRSVSVSRTISYRPFFERKADRQRVRPQVKEDLQKALCIARQVVDMTSDSHQSRGIFLYTLGSILCIEYDEGEKGDTLSALREGIHFLRRAIDNTPEESPNRGKYLNELGSRLQFLYSRTGEKTYNTESIKCLDSVIRHDNSSPQIRIAAAKSLLHFSHDIEVVFEGGCIAVGLIPKLASMSLDHSDKQEALGRVFDMASDVAALGLILGKGPLVALELLEQGRGAFSKSLQDMRVDLRELRERYPQLAARFFDLQQLFAHSAVANSPSLREMDEWEEIYQRSRASKEFDKLLHEIRVLPNFERFLTLPGEAEVRAAANDGPIVVINVSRFGCHAILIESQEIRVILLPDLDRDEIDDKVEKNDFGSTKTLEWLWYTIGHPVLNDLGFTQTPHDEIWPRVWWISTGALNRFPLHAAGCHGTSETVLDRVMSSYSSSIRAIVYTRRSRVRPSSPAKALVVAMEHTPGCARLPFAGDEVTMLQDRCKSLSLETIEPGKSRKDVMDHLPECEIFHFAGHGYTDFNNPFDSHLRLQDWKDQPLTVRDLLQVDLHKNPPFLAYLSACGTGRIEEGRFIDESFNLISAFQLAGFRHVIGTLWEVNDSVCVDMARVTYDEMKNGSMSDNSVCQGLHNASRHLRNRWLRSLKPTRKTEEAEMIDSQDTPTSTKRHKARRLSPGDGEADRLHRDIITLSDSDDYCVDSKPPHWVPYVHFGI